MNERLDSPREFSAPVQLRWRAACVALLAAFASGVGLSIAGVVASQPRWLLAGLGVFALAWIARGWLQRQRELGAAQQTLAAVWEDAPAPDDARLTELLALLERWEALEGKRGSTEFDPWALQSLRNRIRQVVESDPALEAVFDRLRQVA